MKFGKTLEKSILPKWRDNYIDYDKLKRLLKEQDEDAKWTEDDESTFVEELVNIQLEKVNSFHEKTINELRERTSACETKLEPLASAENKDDSKNAKDDDNKEEKNNTKDEAKVFKEVIAELDDITNDINELEKFSRINFTGFLKAAKKHDRLRPPYKSRPILQVRLSTLPFNSEDYSPLIYRISTLYSFIRTRSDKEQQDTTNGTANAPSDKKYESHKFWVHPDNLLEVKTYLLRRLPVLIYNPQTAKVADARQSDPTVTSLYFDSPQFKLYNDKLNKHQKASSLRLRWYGQLAERPEIDLERKIVPAIDEDESTGIEERLPLKEKYVKGFLNGETPRSVQKLRERQTKSEGDIQKTEDLVKDLHKFIDENQLQPMVRAVYTRTAFQIPGDDRIRASLDTEVTLIREDALDARRPCRDPDDWHRRDIDEQRLSFPFRSISKGEISRFPYALLEIKILHTTNSRSREWISDLMTSHLVHEAPRFSKFVHGVAVLFDDYVNSLPFWLGDMDKDIRKDPKTAWEAEQAKIKKQSEEEEHIFGSLGKGSPLIGSFLGSPSRIRRKDGGLKVSGGKQRTLSESSVHALTSTSRHTAENTIREEGAITEEEEEEADDFPDIATGIPIHKTKSQNISDMIGSFAKKRMNNRRESILLPPGVTKPTSLIKNAGPVQVEAKVWLANQRTFIKWQHISVLLATLSLGLYNAAGEHNILAQSIGVVFTAVAIFSGIWGWWMYMRRSKWITERSGKDFDNSIGPVVVCITLIVALVLNFIFKFQAMQEQQNQDSSNSTMSTFDREAADMIIQGKH